MSGSTGENGSKIKLHKFRQGEWVEVLVGQLEIRPGLNQLLISYAHRIDTLPAEFPEPEYQPPNHVLTLPLRKLREVERDETGNTRMMQTRQYCTSGWGWTRLR